MKKESLLELGLTEEQAAKVFELSGKDVENVKAKYADYDGLKDQLAEAGRTIEGFQSLDVDGMRKATDDWKEKFESAQRDHAAKLSELEFTALLDGAVTAAKGRNAKAIRALLDVDGLKTSKNREQDVKAALDALKEESGYLFESEQTPPPYAAGTGSTPILGKTTDKMTYTELCAYMDQNPGAQI